MVKVKVIFGKVAIGALANEKLKTEEVETRIYRKGDIFECPENLLKAVSGSNQIKVVDEVVVVEPTKPLENTNVYGSTDRRPADALGPNRSAAQSPAKK